MLYGFLCTKCLNKLCWCPASGADRGGYQKSGCGKRHSNSGGKHLRYSRRLQGWIPHRWLLCKKCPYKYIIPLENILINNCRRCNVSRVGPLFYSIIPSELCLSASQEEDGNAAMEKERRRDAMKAKLQRLQECILKTRKKKEGVCFFCFFTHFLKKLINDLLRK